MVSLLFAALLASTALVQGQNASVPLSNPLAVVANSTVGKSLFNVLPPVSALLSAVAVDGLVTLAWRSITVLFLWGLSRNSGIGRYSKSAGNSTTTPRCLRQTQHALDHQQ